MMGLPMTATEAADDGQFPRIGVATSYPSRALTYGTLSLERFLHKAVVPMLPGAQVEGSNYVAKRARTEIVSSVSPNEIRVRQNAQSKEWFSIKRLQKWRD